MKTKNNKKIMGALVVLGMFALLPLLAQGANNVDVIGIGEVETTDGVSKLDEPVSQVPEEREEIEAMPSINPPLDVVTPMGTDNPIVGPPIEGPFSPMSSENPIVGPPLDDTEPQEDGPMDGVEIEDVEEESFNVRGLTATTAYTMV